MVRNRHVNLPKTTLRPVLASNILGAQPAAAADLLIAITLFFPLYWAYNDEVPCCTQPSKMKVLALQQVQYRRKRVAIHLRNI